LRALIETRLRAARPAADPKARFLAHVEGPVSPEMLAAMERPRSAAAVLLALIDRPGGLTVLFTERARHLRDHPGQISFPGGRVQPSDADVIAAALRESEEEVGLVPAAGSVAGCLEPQVTGTGFLITPVVGFIAGDFRAVPDPDEVASVFEAPLEFVLDERNVRPGLRERLGTVFHVEELHYGEHVIWGATAAMLSSFREVVGDYKTRG
jgi:8-oxo-dGTP pyrophosphatase MutT (NUDIX family)